MSTIGLDRLVYAKITEDESGNEPTAFPERSPRRSTRTCPWRGRGNAFCDDGAAEHISEFQSGKLTLGVNDIGRVTACDLTGASVDDNGVLISGSEDAGGPVAIGFRARRANGLYRYFWLYRVLFKLPSAKLETKGDKISFQTPSIDGTVYRRNRLDGNGKHPWKAEVTEGDANVSPATIAGWYGSVYEPNYARSDYHQHAAQCAVVTAGAITGMLTVVVTTASGL
jgi:phi13 family phage major tail protein